MLLDVDRRIDLIKHYRNKEKYGYCGPACIQISLSALGIQVDQDTLAEIGGFTTHWGVDHHGLKRMADKYAFGFPVLGESLDVLGQISINYPVTLNIMDLDEKNPNIYEDGHYVVLFGVDSKGVYYLDPSSDQTSEPIKKPRAEFEDMLWWDIDKNGVIIKKWALAIFPSLIT